MNEFRTLLSPPTLTAEAGQLSMGANDNLATVSAKRLQEQRRRARMIAKQQQVAERLSTATQELSAGVNQSQSAMQELQQALEQMATGAEQASAACEESTQSLAKIVENVEALSKRATHSMNRGMQVQQLIISSASEINRLVDGVASSAEKSSSSASLIMELEHLAREIGNIISTVVNLADQTNLLALNAAIEAARAGEHGSGFAIVADEVRSLAEIVEQSAGQIRSVVEEVQTEVGTIAEAFKTAEQISLQEMKNGQDISGSLLRINEQIQLFAGGTKAINDRLLSLRDKMEEFESGAKTIAESAEEQSTASNQALRAVMEQNKALYEINQSASELTDLSEDLRVTKDVRKSMELLAAAADELSATIAEGSQSANQIMVAINMIDRSAEQQSAATEQSSRAVSALEAEISEVSAQSKLSEQRIKEIAAMQDDSKRMTERLVGNISITLGTHSSNLQLLLNLESRIRKVDKIVNTIDRVGIQTNMLAVNGAIEAAGAGKYGRGFAVVSGDIRNLAKETAANADQIKELVRDIQNQVMLVIRDSIAAQDSTRSEVEKARRIVQDMSRYESEVSDLVGGIIANNENLREVEIAITESKKAVEQIASAAMEAAAASRQASNAGREQHLGLSELTRAVEEIAVMAEDLQM